jgi:tetratricopeptide (TPR) repeat protein
VNLILLLLIADFDGVVRTSDSKPVAGAAVSISERLATRTDAEGRFHFPALPSGSYMLRVQMAGFAPFASSVSIAEKDIRLDVKLTPAEFFDEPTFVVAGVTDTVNRGGHGSETTIRSSEAVARAAAALGSAPARESAEQLRKRVAADPSNAALHHALASAEEREGNALEAAREYQKAADLAPTGDYVFDWGTDLLTHRAAEQAAEVFSRGHRLFPASARMLLGLGASLYARGAYDEAVRRIFEAADLQPGDPGPYLFLGSIESTDIVHAEGYIMRMERFARLHPERAEAKYFYAKALWDNRADAGAAAPVIELLRDAAKLDPTLADARLELGIVRSDLGEFTDAVSEFRSAIDLGSSRNEVHYRLAQAYQHVGESTEAQKELQIFERLKRTSAEQEEQQRSRIRQFIFELRQR